jgi:hypothetical protein
MTKTNHNAPVSSGQYRIALTKTQHSPQWWAYQITDVFTGALMAGGEVRGSRVLALVEAQREVRKLEGVRQPFYIPPVTNGYHIPC